MIRALRVARREAMKARIQAAGQLEVLIVRSRNLQPPRQTANGGSIVAVTEGWPTALRTALRRGQQLVAEVHASRPDRRAWIAIYPIRHVAPTGDKQAFNLFHREFEASYIDSDRCIGPGDGMIDLRVAQAQDEKELSELLISWGVDPDQLTYVHRTAYPVRLGPASVGGPAAGPTDAIRRLATKD